MQNNNSSHVVYPIGTLCVINQDFRFDKYDKKGANGKFGILRFYKRDRYARIISTMFGFTDITTLYIEYDKKKYLKGFECNWIPFSFLEESINSKDTTVRTNTTHLFANAVKISSKYILNEIQDKIKNIEMNIKKVTII